MSRKTREEVLYAAKALVLHYGTVAVLGRKGIREKIENDYELSEWPEADKALVVFEACRIAQRVQEFIGDL